MLDEQYRMHPSISNFPNTEFYGRRLKDGTIDAAGQPGVDWMPPVSAFYTPTDMGLQGGGGEGNVHGPSAVFLDHQGPESRRGRSLVNVQEAEIVRLVVEDLLLRNPVRLFPPLLPRVSRVDTSAMCRTSQVAT